MTWPTLLDRRGFAFVLLALWALAYLPNLGLRTLRLEEGRRATPAREMLASGEFVRPTIYGETYLSKPPLYYWIVAALGSILGEVSPLAVRIPSALAALACASVAYCFAAKSLARRTRALAALFVLSSAALLDKGTLGEIDATLCVFVAAALKFWWDGNLPDRQTNGGWALAGMMLGFAVMLKGPAGPAIFYLTVGPYLIWVGRWRRLFTLGHVACLALTALPAACWAVALVNSGVISVPDLFVLWRRQLGSDYAAASLADPVGQASRLINHYVSFPLRAFGLLMPAVLWLPFALCRKRLATGIFSGDLRRLLLSGVLVPCVAFYLYSESRPRHLMAAFFPMALLASLTAMAMVKQSARLARLGHVAAIALSLAPMALTAAGFVITISFRIEAAPWAMLELLIGAAWSWIALRVTRNTPAEFGTVSFAVAAASNMLAAWFVVNSAVIPWKAPTNSGHRAQELSQRLPPDAIVYTTRTFPTKGDGYFNLQFHLGKNLRAADDVEALEHAAPCLAVVLPEERAELAAAGWNVQEIGRIGGTPGAPPEAVVIRLASRCAKRSGD